MAKQEEDLRVIIIVHGSLSLFSYYAAAVATAVLADVALEDQRVDAASS